MTHETLVGGQYYHPSELPVVIVFNGLDGPVELLTQSLGEELLNRDAKLLGKDYSEARIDVILKYVLA